MEVITWVVVIVLFVVIVGGLVWWWLTSSKSKKPPSPSAPTDIPSLLTSLGIDTSTSSFCSSSLLPLNNLCVNNQLVGGNTLWPGLDTGAVVGLHEPTLKKVLLDSTLTNFELLPTSSDDPKVKTRITNVGLARGQWDASNFSTCSPEASCHACSMDAKITFGTPLKSSANTWVTPYACLPVTKETEPWKDLNPSKPKTPDDETTDDGTKDEDTTDDPKNIPWEVVQPPEVVNLIKVLGLRFAPAAKCSQGTTTDEAVVCVYNGREGGKGKLFPALEEDDAVGVAVSTLISMASGQNTRNKNFVLPSPFDPCPDDPECTRGVAKSCCRTNVGFAEGRNLDSQAITSQCSSISGNVKCYPCANNFLPVPGGSWEDLRQHWWTSYICAGQPAPRTIIFINTPITYEPEKGMGLVVTPPLRNELLVKWLKTDLKGEVVETKDLVVTSSDALQLFSPLERVEYRVRLIHEGSNDVTSFMRIQESGRTIEGPIETLKYLDLPTNKVTLIRVGGVITLDLQFGKCQLGIRGGQPGGQSQWICDSIPVRLDGKESTTFYLPLVEETVSPPAT